MTMFNINDDNNNVSRDKPVEHIPIVIGLHVSAYTSCTRTMRVRGVLNAEGASATSPHLSAPKCLG